MTYGHSTAVAYHKTVDYARVAESEGNRNKCASSYRTKEWRKREGIERGQ